MTRYRPNPRSLVLSLAALSTASCVVPAARYDEARSALAVEQEGHRRTHVKMYELQQRLAAANADLAAQHDRLLDRDRLLAEHEKLLAQSELDLAVATRDRESASELVDQLRGELARVGEHLHAFANQKAELEQSLDAAEARAGRLAEVERAAARRALAVRDLTLALHEPIARGAVSFSVDDGRPVLRMPVDLVYVEGADDVSPDARSILAAVARVVLGLEGTQLEVTENDAERSRGISDNLLVRLERIAKALTDDGVPQGRVVVAVPPVAKPGSAEAGTESSDGELPASKPYVSIALVPQSA